MAARNTNAVIVKAQVEEIKALKAQVKDLRGELEKANQALLDERGEHEKTNTKLREDRAALIRERGDLKDRLKREECRTKQTLDAAEEGCTAAGISTRLNIRLMDHIDWMERRLDLKGRGR